MLLLARDRVEKGLDAWLVPRSRDICCERQEGFALFAQLLINSLTGTGTDTYTYSLLIGSFISISTFGSVLVSLWHLVNGQARCHGIDILTACM